MFDDISYLFIHIHIYLPLTSHYVGRTTEALRALQSISDVNDVTLAATLAMMHAHKQTELVDREAIANLEVQDGDYWEMNVLHALSTLHTIHALHIWHYSILTSQVINALFAHLTFII